MASNDKGTVNARQVARDVSKALGRTIDAKRVRAWVRDNVAAFDDDGYTTHAYTPALARTIVAGMTKSRKADRSKSAAEGRKATTTRKPAPVAPETSADA